jgi:hypothetical protein
MMIIRKANYNDTLKKHNVQQEDQDLIMGDFRNTMKAIARLGDNWEGKNEHMTSLISRPKMLSMDERSSSLPQIQGMTGVSNANFEKIAKSRKSYNEQTVMNVLRERSLSIEQQNNKNKMEFLKYVTIGKRTNEVLQKASVATRYPASLNPHRESQYHSRYSHYTDTMKLPTKYNQSPAQVHTTPHIRSSSQLVSSNIYAHQKKSTSYFPIAGQFGKQKLQLQNTSMR